MDYLNHRRTSIAISNHKRTNTISVNPNQSYETPLKIILTHTLIPFSYTKKGEYKQNPATYDEKRLQGKAVIELERVLYTMMDIHTAGMSLNRNCIAGDGVYL